MTLSPAELTDLVYGFYPRGVAYDDPRYREATESKRLLEARRKAGEERTAWRALVQRLRGQLPGREVRDRILARPWDGLGSAYACVVELPVEPGEHRCHQHYLRVLVSFLAPVYALVSGRFVVEDEPGGERETVDIYVHDTDYAVPAAMVTPELSATLAAREAAEAQRRALAAESPAMAAILSDIQARPATRHLVSFALSPAEEEHARRIVRVIEESAPHERLYEGVGGIIVPDVEVRGRRFGEVALRDALLSDD